MSAKDGGSAFPEHGLSGLPNGEFIHPMPGMSLRDWFAGKALEGDLAAQSNETGEWIKPNYGSLAGRCYAEALMDKRWGKVHWGVGQKRERTSAANWQQPLLWERQAARFEREHGRRRRVFCASLADVFDNEVSAEWRADLFGLIEATPHLDWLILTKRIGNVHGMLPDNWGAGYPNVWIGATVVNQEEADRDIPKLMRIRAVVRFLSVEPLLGHVDLSRWLDIIQYEDGASWGRRNIGHLHCMLDWVIVGGESGNKARPMHPDWARSLRDQCHAADVPFLFKQWGEWFPRDQWEHNPLLILPDDHLAYDSSEKTIVLNGDNGCDLYPMHRVGKHNAGRMLDGVLHTSFPIGQD